MILCWRRVENPTFRGFNFFHSRDWPANPEGPALEAFAAFDEIMLRIKSDPEATQLPLAGAEGERELAALHTATQAALRALSVRRRPTAELYSLSQAPHSFWTNFPRWLKVFVEDAQGQVGIFQSPDLKVARTWWKAPLEKGDLFLHAAPLAAEPRTRLEPGPDRGWLRWAHLIEKPELTVSLRVEAEDKR